MLTTLVLLCLCISQLQAITYRVIGDDKYSIAVCLHYDSCKEDCWITMKPGELRDFHAGLCRLNMIEANTIDRPQSEGGNVGSGPQYPNLNLPSLFGGIYIFTVVLKNNKLTIPWAYTG